VRLSRVIVSATIVATFCLAPATAGFAESSAPTSTSASAAATTKAPSLLKEFKNCTALNKTYPHGVGKKGAKDKTSGTRVTNFRVNTTVYNQNKKSDRDKDGIACEKK